MPPKPEADDSLSDRPTLDGTAVPAAASTAQTKVGSYTIVGRLGEGGMGVVYEALQENPRRPVALKIIRGGSFVDDHSVRMFQREAQVLGRLKHPGIAAIYESGRTDDGQHFFAMELVRGARLDEYLKREAAAGGGGKAEVRRRLELFLRICDAVSYAHQRGVIHRDLKPANILVQAPEAVTVASTGSATASGIQVEIKVLDFGLARLAEDELGGASLMTRPGTVQGTVPYMSPEQVRGNTDQVDLRSDVYALGVILYEMLAGELPYDLRRASLPEAARIICEQPPRPLAATMVGRGAIGHEIVVIIGKALAKDPAERYQSVAALAEDIHRSLNDQPILAQSPSTVYQLRKLVARHRVGFAFATALVVLLAGFAVTMAVAAGRIASQRDRANREAQVAGQVSSFLINLFQVSKPELAQGKTITARALLDKGASGIQSDRAMDPEVKASLLDTMGDAYSSLGFFSQSQPLLQAALATRTALFGGQSLQVAQTLRNLGLLALNRGDDRGAQGYYQRALAVYQKVEGPANRDVATLLNDMGTALDHTGELDAAQSYFERSLAMRIQLDGANSPELIPMRTNLAYIAYSQKDYAAAEQQFQQELALAKKVYGPDHPFVSKITNNLGGVLFTEKKYAAAETYYAQALTLNRKLLGNQHPEIALDLANIAEARDAQGDLAGSEGSYRQALAILQGKVPDTDIRWRFIATNLGSVLVREGGAARLGQAEPLLRAALAADQKALKPGAWDIAEAQSELGACLLAQGRYAAAEPLLAGSFPTLRAKLGAHDPVKVTRALGRIVELYQRWGKPRQAARYRAMEKGQ
ncbi:MAG TPA: serine/threonine-protein kinase [Terriglobales bacterium]|nr:serine/threonine-protein kinase [Terriglobales bacterium]HVA63185.1 serine/threonine-protein kinase [Terriglobales bacterium]